MEQKNIKQLYNVITLLSVFLGSLVIVNVLFLYFIRNSVGTITLLKQQLIQLEEDQQIISQSQEIYELYEDEIDVISAVFPDEESILEFIQTLELLIQNTTSEYTLTFDSLVPVIEGDRRFLLMTISMNADYLRMTSFLRSLETLPYMTHVTFINSQSPQGFFDTSQIKIGLKVYVQNPFSTT